MPGFPYLFPHFALIKHFLPEELNAPLQLPVLVLVDLPPPDLQDIFTLHNTPVAVILSHMVSVLTGRAIVASSLFFWLLLGIRVKRLGERVSGGK